MSRGFTLIETVITVVLFTVLALAVAQLNVFYDRTILFQKASIEIISGGNAVVDAVRVAGLQARHVVAAHTFSSVEYSSGATAVVFELPAVDAEGAVLPDTYDYVVVDASGASAFRRTDAAPGSARLSGEKRLTSVLGAISFSYDDPDFPSVRSVTVDATTSAATAQLHLRGQVRLRNP